MAKLRNCMIVALLLASIAETRAGDLPEVDAYPIIAQLYDDPAHYTDRLITIYGLVVDAASTSHFMLQDVSQRPLKVVGDGETRAAVGDQLMILGRLRVSSEGPYLEAQRLVRTQVLAGGGCC